jgi:hypothetical protein
MDAGHWNIDIVGEFDPSRYFGFIYIIEELSTGKAYLGKKFFKFKRNKPSGWQTYQSSCAPLQQLIEDYGPSAFSFRILRLCSGRCELSYTEEETQFHYDVLRARLPNGERKFFNKTIGYRNFAGLEKQTLASHDLRRSVEKD